MQTKTVIMNKSHYKDDPLTLLDPLFLSLASFLLFIQSPVSQKNSVKKKIQFFILRIISTSVCTVISHSYRLNFNP